MDPNAAQTIPWIDDAVLKAIAGLRASLASQPDSRSTRLALDGILARFIEDARADEKVEGSLAIPRLEQLAALFPESPEPYLHLSQVCLERQDYQGAQRYAEKGLEVEPGHSGLVFNRALALEEMGDYDGAIIAFNHVLEADPTDIWAHTNIGDAYRLQKRFDQAEVHLQKALELDEDFVPALHNLAMLYHDQDNWPACVHYGLRALHYEPQNKETHLAVAEACMGLKERQAALQHLVAATLVDPDFVAAYESMSAAYIDLEMYDLAVGAALEALQREPLSWMALANIACAYGKKGDFAQAIQAYEAVLTRVCDPEPRYQLLWDLGWNCFMADQYAPALDYTDQAIELREHPDLMLFFNRGLILLAMGNAAQANAVYSQTMQRAEALGSHEPLAEARGDLQAYLRRTGQEVEADSAMALLLQGPPNL